MKRASLERLTGKDKRYMLAKHSRSGWLILLAVLFGYQAYAWQTSAEERYGGRPLPPGVEVVRDVVYGKGGGRSLTLDILRLKESAKASQPVVVYVHGGGWSGGSKAGAPPLLAALAQRGYFCATIDYRLSQEARFPAQIEDCKCAIRFLRSRAREYNLNPDRIGVWGHSAGGHLVALLGTTGDVKDLEGDGGSPKVSSRVQAVLDCFGPTDFARMADFPSRIDHNSSNSPESRLVGGPVQQKKEEVRRANPITYVTKDDPPFLIMHGDQDPLVPLNQSQLLLDALKKAGVDASLHVVKGGGHGFGSKQIDEMTLAFFDRTLKTPAAPSKNAKR
jgi:acetyl esterase/lipase